MPNLTPETMVELWRAAKERKQPDDPGLAAFQKFMILHEDMHEHWERLEKDPASTLEVEGENLLLHIAMDAGTEQSLLQDEPEGIRGAFTELLEAGIPEGGAFHVIAQAMTHEFILAAREGQEVELTKYLDRARDYSQQVIAQVKQNGQGPAG